MSGQETKTQCANVNPLECCLFFTANSLARAITRLGEEEFAKVAMSPSYAFLLSLVIDTPGIPQKELATTMCMAASTVSRFVDSLERRGLLYRQGQGRHTFVHPTREGESLKPAIDEAWQSLYNRYSRILGKDFGDQLTLLTARASHKLLEE